MKNMTKVLLTDNLNPQSADILRDAGIEPIIENGIPPEALVERLSGVDGIVVRSSTRLTAEVIEATNLKVIGRAGIGLDNVDIEAATEKGVVVMNTPGGNTITTAEHALAMMMALVRHIPQAAASMGNGEWEKKRFVGTELFGKTLGVVGLGNIGRIVADRALGLKMQVIASDPFISVDAAKRLGVELVPLDELLARAHIITVHVPKTAETRHIIDDDAFAQMRDGVFVVNCARGGVVEETALLAALESGKVAGAAVDVFEEEPPPQDNPLRLHPRVITTPHLGASTEEAQVNVALAIARQVGDYLTTGEIRNAVNFPALGAEAYQALKPWISLARRMGALLSQVTPGTMEELTVECAGDLPGDDHGPLASAALEGLLKPVLGSRINLINARPVALGRGLRLKETRASTPEDFVSLLSLRYRAGGGFRSIAGSIFGRSEPRIVCFDDYRIDLSPEGRILLLLNDDKPGVIGAAATILGAHGVNIAGLQLGRDQPGGLALSFVHVDDVIPESAMNGIIRVDHVVKAVQVDLG